MPLRAQVVGLTVAPDRLIQIRRNRLRSLSEDRESSYVDTDSVRQEIVDARRLFERQGWPVIDVTRRSVEETAAAVINIISRGRGMVGVVGGSPWRRRAPPARPSRKARAWGSPPSHR